MTAKGKIPVEHDFETMGDDISDEMMDQARPFLMVTFTYDTSFIRANILVGKSRGRGEREEKREACCRRVGE